jgi:hypothetical protein
LQHLFAIPTEEDMMGLLRGAAKAAIAAKVFDIARRELSKPENQAKIKELIGKVAARAAKGRR